MKILEHKSKEIFRKYNLPVPEGSIITSSSQAIEVARKLFETSSCVVLKAQVPSGGRGKGYIIKDGQKTGGGVRIVRSIEEAEKESAFMLGGKLITVQNRSGVEVQSILVEQGIEFSKQYYIAFIVDRQKRTPICVASREGGTEIEELAASNPGSIHKMPVDILTGWMPFHGRTLCSKLCIEKDLQKQFTDIARKMYDLFIAEDCSLVEINPLVSTPDGSFICLDAKIVIDDNAIFRHPQFAQSTPPPEEEKEYEAKKVGLSYIKLNGNIGCLVNGAGLAMATMDIIKFFGGEPANFLDVGGTASEEAVKKAFTIILTDPAVRAIFVNIFGGIMRCDVIANGIVSATKDLGLKVPLVVRLEGNMVQEGRRILAESGLKIITAQNMEEGARLAVEVLKN